MYDKIVIWKSRMGDEYPHLLTLLSDAKEQTDLETGEIKAYGSLQGMRVGIYPTAIRIEGSIAKFLYDIAKYGSYTFGLSFTNRSRISIAALCIFSLSSKR